MGRHDDFVYFVPFTAPGDKIRAQVVHTKKNYADAKLVELLEPSASRVNPPCPVFGICGGCQWQHVSYEEQLNQKQKIVEHALNRIAKENVFELKNIIPSPEHFNYRNRAQVRTDGPKVGFYKRNSHELVEFEKCYIVEEPINNEINNLKLELHNQVPGKMSKVEIFLTEEGKVSRSSNKSHGEEMGFSQVNSAQNSNLQKYITELVGKPKTTKENALLDLYCGNGNFSTPLGLNGWEVYGIDGSRVAIDSARKNKVGTNYFTCDDCSIGVRKLNQSNKKFNTIILDPPRIGLDDKLPKQLWGLDAKTLIYVSCNPATFARDWARIKSHTKFELVSVQPFDMFPQTFHVELVALAKRP